MLKVSKEVASPAIDISRRLAPGIAEVVKVIKAPNSPATNLDLSPEGKDILAKITLNQVAVIPTVHVTNPLQRVDLKA